MWLSVSLNCQNGFPGSSGVPPMSTQPPAHQRAALHRWGYLNCRPRGGSYPTAKFHHQHESVRYCLRYKTSKKEWEKVSLSKINIFIRYLLRNARKLTKMRLYKLNYGGKQNSNKLLVRCQPGSKLNIK